MAGVGMAGAGPVSAAGNTFASQWADADWSGSVGTSSWQLKMAPGKDNHNGVVTEYLKISVTARFCTGGYIYVAALSKNEQANDLAGVDVQSLNGKATVNRTTVLPGTLTKTRSTNCVSASGTPVSMPLPVPVTLKGSWRKAAAAVAYTGEDCGGTGNCTYFDAKATGSVKVLGHTLDTGTTSKAWLWHGLYNLSA